MKKLLFLLATIGIIFSACENNLRNDSNGKPPFVPEISYSPKFLEFDSKGGKNEIVITANFEYEVSENTDWIDVEMLETGVNVIAKENKNTYERSASIVIFNEEYDITKFIEIRQAAYIPQIELSQQSIEVGFMSGTYTINITSDCYWEATSKNDWIFVENYIGVAGVKELKFSIERNEETKNREGIIVIKNEDYNLVATLHVVQKSFPSTDRVILYTTSDGKIVTPYNETSFDADVVSNTYEYGQGVMVFDTPVTLIDDYAFYGERNLANITIPDSIIHIGEKAFYGCISLQNITIGNGLTKIGSEAFTDCSSLKDVYIKDLSAWLKIEMNSYNCNPLLNGAKLYLNGEELTELTIPSDITEIKYGAFENCISLTSVTIPNSVTKIDSCAFMNCTSLTDVTIGNSLSSIGYLVFAFCSSLTNITIPDNIKSIGHYAFKGCKSLTNITIPQNVTIIEKEAFMDCTSLICIYCRPITPPRGGSDMFRNNAMGRTIYVPSESVNTYKRVEWWADYDYCIESYNF